MYALFEAFNRKMTVNKVYEYTKIKISVKCINVNRQQVEIFDHNNSPDLSVLQLLLMTTAIPTFFKPIKYNDNYYVDGGINGNLPIEALDSDKYLCTAFFNIPFPIPCITLKLFRFDSSALSINFCSFSTAIISVRPLKSI